MLPRCFQAKAISQPGAGVGTSKVVIPIGHPNGTTRVLAFDNQIAALAASDTIRGATSGATATVVDVDDFGTTGVLYLKGVTGAFQNNEAIQVAGATKADANGADQALPGDQITVWARLSHVMLMFDTIVTAVTATWYVAEDAAGDVPITPAQTDTIEQGKTTTSDGSVARRLDHIWTKDATLAADGRLYLVVKLNAGSANVLPRLQGERVST